MSKTITHTLFAALPENDKDQTYGPQRNGYFSQDEVLQLLDARNVSKVSCSSDFFGLVDIDKRVAWRKIKEMNKYRDRNAEFEQAHDLPPGAIKFRVTLGHGKPGTDIFTGKKKPTYWYLYIWGQGYKEGEKEYVVN